MRKSIIYILLCLISIVEVQAQTWSISKHIESDIDLRIYDIQTDQNDDIYVAGAYRGSLYDSTALGPLYDIFLMKLNQNF